MLVFIGASASGKTEIVKILIRDYGFNKIITHTTRKKRKNEIDGIDYHFLSLTEFLSRKDENYFIETEKYDGNYYGTAFKDTGINNVLIVDPNGANSIYDKEIPNTLFFLLETIIGPVWVWMVIKEQPSIETIQGGMIIILTIAIHSFLKLKKS